MSDQPTTPNPKTRGLNRGGRRPGQVNRIGKDIRERFKFFIEERFDRFLEAYDALPPGEQVKFYIQASEYVLPKLARQEITGEGGGPVLVQVNRLPPPVPAAEKAKE